jgi:hypothetical protein
MPWTVEKTKEITFKNQGFTVNITNTGFNLLFEIYEHLFGRIFFAVDYWPAVKEAIENVLAAVKTSTTESQEVIVTGQKNVKLVFAYDKKSDKIIISRMKSDSAGLTWLLDKDSGRQGLQYRRIRVPVEIGNLRRFFTIMDQLYKMIDKGEIKKPKTEGYDLYYANEMARHDRSMLAFKALLDDDDFTFFLRLDENLKKSDRSYKVTRAQVAQEAKEAGVPFLPEKRGDDGFITLSGENIVVDWEIRRDWVMNYNNIPVRYDDRNNTYHAVEYPPPNPGEPKEPLSPEFDSLPALIAFMNKKRLRHEKPYFIYETLGQFGRKMAKPEIMLSAQCTHVSPQWPETKKTPIGAFFVAAWHEDFVEAGTVTRTTEAGAGELGDYWDCDNYGIFEFNKSGVELFKKTLRKQYADGVTEDRNGNTIPRNRQWL